MALRSYVHGLAFSKPDDANKLASLFEWIDRKGAVSSDASHRNACPLLNSLLS